MIAHRFCAGYEVRSWDRSGLVVDHSTHYAVIAWTDGELEEADQLDRAIEVTADDAFGSDLIQQVEKDLDKVEEECFCECEACKSGSVCERVILIGQEIVALTNRLDRLREAAEQIEHLRWEWQRRQITLPPTASPVIGTHREAA